ncbi:MAG: hypothetical protein U0Q16_15440 [Bryobacteraceae bacterium]
MSFQARLLRSFAVFIFLTAAAFGQNYVIQTVAGAYPLGNGGPAAQALVAAPTAVAADRLGNVFFNDSASGLRVVRQSGIVEQFGPPVLGPLLAEPSGTLLAGGPLALIRLSADGKQPSLVAGNGRSQHSGDDGPATAAGIGFISGIARGNDGTLYISDALNHVVRKIDPTGKITTIVGRAGNRGSSGDNGAGTQALLYLPGPLALDGDENLYIGDTGNSVVRKLDKAGMITRVAGDGFFFTPEIGPANRTSFGIISDLQYDGQGNLLIADSYFDVVVKLAIGASTVSFFAGNTNTGFSGDGGPASGGLLYSPSALAINGTTVYIADSGNDRIRRVADSSISTLAGRSHFDGDGQQANKALLNVPFSVALDGQGNVYVSDTGNQRVRKITPTGVITTIAGNGQTGSGADGASATSSRLYNPGPIVADGSGNIIFADRSNYRVRKISPTGAISTILGNGTRGDKAESVPGTSAQIGNIDGLAIDSTGIIYAADTSFHKVRKVTADGTVSTVAGTGTRGFTGDGALATAAQLDTPRGLAIDKDGALIIADSGNGRIRKVTMAGTISTIAGSGTAGPVNDGASATAVSVGTVRGIVGDAAGNLFVSSFTLGRVFRISTDGKIFTVAGGRLPDPIDGTMGDGGPATNAGLWGPSGLAINRDGDIFFTDSLAQRVRRLAINTPAQLEIVSGNNQTGPAGSALAAPLVVRVMGKAAAPAVGVTVAFAVTTGEARLSVTSTTTDSTGRAGVSVTPTRAGAVRVTATIAGLTPVNFDITATPAIPPPAATQVTSAGQSTPAVTTLAPQGLAWITGGPFAADGVNENSGGAFALKLGGVCVKMGGADAPIGSVTPTKLLIQVPVSAAGPAKLQVIRNCGDSTQILGPESSVTVADASPEFFYWVRNADGKNPVMAVDAETSTPIGTPGIMADRETTPAVPGRTISIDATGFGLKTDAIALGEGAGGPNAALLAAKVRLGDVDLPAANVVYAGAAPGAPGMDRLTILLPEDTPDGDLPIIVTLGDFSSPAGAFVTVKKP